MGREIFLCQYVRSYVKTKTKTKKTSRNKRIKAKLPPRDSSDLIIHFTVLLGYSK